MKQPQKMEHDDHEIKENVSSLKLYRGIVEDNVSPKKDGRLRVRIKGIHSDDKGLVKTDDLPWCEVMQSQYYGFGSGIGISSIPQIGSWVFVLLENDNPNMPVVIGAVQAKYTEANGVKGETLPITSRLNEEDVNRLTRVEKLGETIHAKINSKLFGTEPPSTNDASKYPNNHTLETISGHVIEVDDSAGNERIRIYHRTGSYYEIKPDGTLVVRSEGPGNHTALIGNLDEVIGGYVQTVIQNWWTVNVANNATITAQNIFLN